MKKSVISVIAVFSLLFLLNFVSAESISEDLHLNIQTTYSNGTINAGTFNFIFNISRDTSCSDIIYTNSTNLTTDSRGIISYYLPNVSLNYSEQYYLCYYRNGVLIDSAKIARTPYSFTARNVTLSGVQPDVNFYLGNFNMSATYYFGNGTYLVDVNDTLSQLSCANDQVAKWNSSSSMWYCSDVAPPGAADIDAVLTDDIYITGGQTQGNVSLVFNETKLNQTIDQKISADNLSIVGWVNLIFNSLSNAVGSIGNWSADKASYYNVTQIGEINVSVTNYINATNQSVINWALSTFTSLSDIVAQVGNWSNVSVNYYNKTEIDEINTSVVNYANLVGGRWDSNYTNMRNPCTPNFVVGIFENGTFECGTVSAAMESDPYWTANYSLFNASWSSTYNQTTNESINNYIMVINDSIITYITVQNDSIVDYITLQNDSVVTYINAVNASMRNYVDTTFINKSSEGSLNVNNSNYLDWYDSSFFMPLNKSVSGDFNFTGQVDYNGGWLNGGVSVIAGDIYAQTGYFYNLTSLSVSDLSINGSLLPAAGFDGVFDIGSPSLRWNNLYLAGTANAEIVNISGTLYVADVNITEYIDSQNQSQTNLINTINQTTMNLINLNNESINDFIDTTNTSMENYVNSQNQSQTNLINLNNASLNNYINFTNTSMQNYVNLQNTSMTNYANYIASLWNNNYTNMQNPCSPNFVVGIFENGTFECGVVTSDMEVDPYWTGNASLFNQSWLNTYNQTTNESINNYINATNTSLVNWVNSTFVPLSSMINYYTKSEVYNKTEIEQINDSMENYVNAQNQSQTNLINTINQTTINLINSNNASLNNYINFTNFSMQNYVNATNESMKNYVDSTFVNQSDIGSLNVNNSQYLQGYNSSFFMPLNHSVYGQFDFNGGWLNDGLSIIDGNLYAQAGYFYNITGLDVNTLKVNGSLLPATGFDGIFDIGSADLRWKDLYLSENANINGTLYVAGVNISENNVSMNNYVNYLASLWNSNYTNLQGDCGAGSFVVGIYPNGTVQCVIGSSAENDSKAYNGTLVDVLRLNNGTYITGIILNNGTYVINTILNNGSYLNVPETDSYWYANYSNMQTNCGSDFVTGIFDNGTFRCGTVSSAMESDPYWSDNYTNLQLDCGAGSFAIGIFENGTVQCSAEVYNGTLVDVLRLNNGTYVTLPILNNGTYITSLILNNGTYTNVTNISYATWLALNNGSYFNTAETDFYWYANYSNMQTNCPVGTYAIGIFENGTFECAAEIDPKAYNGTLVDVLRLNNGTYITGIILNNGTYVINTILNNGSYLNVPEIDPYWFDNYTNMQTNCGSDFVTGIFENGTFRCGTVSAAMESDPYWTGNVSLFNQSWLTTYNQTTNDSINNYINATNTSLVNWVNSTFLPLSSMINYYTKSEVYNKTEIDEINTSMENYVDYVSSRWEANYTNLQEDCGVGSFVVGIYPNGTVQCLLGSSAENDSKAYNGTLVDVLRLNNGTYVIISTLNNGTYTNVTNTSYATWLDINNGTYIVSSILNNGTYTNVTNTSYTTWAALNNGSYFNAVETDPYWFDNYTNMQTSCGSNFVTGIYPNGTFICGTVEQASESDPYWFDNYTNMQTDCGAGSFAIGIFENGTVQCSAETYNGTLVDVLRLNNGTYVISSILNNGSYLNAGEIDPYWKLNYTNMQTNCSAGSFAVGIFSNGTVQCMWGSSAENDSKAYNGTLVDVLRLNNGTYITGIILNNGTYVISNILNNGSYLNTPDNDTYWYANYSNMQTSCGSNFVTGIYPNGTFICGTVSQASESDPYWFDNYTNLQLDCGAGSFAIGIFENGTVQCSAEVYNGTLVDLLRLNNGTYVTLPILNNGTYVTLSILNNGSYLNNTEVDPLWYANYTNMQADCSAGSFAVGLFPNGTVQCISASSVESDPKAYNGTLVDLLRLNNGTYVTLPILNNGTYVINTVLNNGTYTNVTNTSYATLLTLNNGTYVISDILNNGSYLNVGETDSYWYANYTNMQTDCGAGSFAIGIFPNGTVQCSAEVYNGTLVDVLRLNNGTYVTLPILNNGTYVTLSILNNGSYLNNTEVDPKWYANYTNMQINCSAGSFAVGIFSNGTVQCTPFASTETDPKAYNGTLVDLLRLNNGTYITNLILNNGTYTNVTNTSYATLLNLNNGTYITSLILNNGTYTNVTNISYATWLALNNGSYFNAAETDSYWYANYTNMQPNCPTGTFAIGIFSNGTFECVDESDPKAYNGTLVDLLRLNNGTYITGLVLNNGTYTNVTNFSYVTWTILNNGSYLNNTEVDPKWYANYTNLQEDCAAGSFVMGIYPNGTVQCISASSVEVDPKAYNGTLVDLLRLNNGTYLISSVLNNGTYVISNILNNGSYFNTADNDTYWYANYSNMQTSCGSNFVTGIYPNGTFICGTVSQASESDPYWFDNYTNMQTSCGSDFVTGIYPNGTFICGTVSQASESDPYWFDNYTNMQTNCSFGTYTTGIFPNGTFKCSTERDSSAYNGTLVDFLRLNNGTYTNVTNTSYATLLNLNNGTYVIISTLNNGTYTNVTNISYATWTALNNGSYFNAAETDS
ncbi:MAG: hypothetical protein ACP5NZ_02640, partial [Nanobdellota archaeon]